MRHADSSEATVSPPAHHGAKIRCWRPSSSGQTAAIGVMLMLSALRAVKVAPPQLPTKIVSRPRLLELLDRAVERPITLISAGPGSGKTVLVNQWARSQARGVIWVSLDPEDDREERFWPLVQYALQQHNGHV